MDTILQNLVMTYRHYYHNIPRILVYNTGPLSSRNLDDVIEISKKNSDRLR